MDVTYRIDKDILYIAIEGRIDASNAAEAEERIFGIKNDNPGKHTVVDADKLEYISSAGLRVILRWKAWGCGKDSTKRTLTSKPGTTARS